MLLLIAPNMPLIALLVCHEFHCAFAGITATRPKAKIIRFFFISCIFAYNMPQKYENFSNLRTKREKNIK
jgi:hypothetical protein